MTRYALAIVLILFAPIAQAGAPSVYNLSTLADGITCLPNYQTFDVSPRNCILAGSPASNGYSGWTMVTLTLDYVGTLVTCLGYEVRVLTDSNDIAAAFPTGWFNITTQSVVGGAVTIQPMVITRTVAAGGPVDLNVYSFAVDYRRLAVSVKGIGVCGATDGLRIKANIMVP